jgi:gliding motility-associated-like protein
VLYVRGAGVSAVNFRIFNRWGKLVFESNSMDFGWDGTMNGKKQEMDGYAYILQVRFINGTSFTKTGNVTLIR